MVLMNILTHTSHISLRP